MSTEQGPARPYVNIEGYPKRAALLLIKYTTKRWLDDNPGFCILIGGTGTRAPNIKAIRYNVRCFGEIRFCNSSRSCVIDAACNASFLLLDDVRVLYMSDRFVNVKWRASQRLWSHNEGEAEVSDFISGGQLGPVLQGLDGDLSIIKMKNIPSHGHHETPSVRFNWLFEKRIMDASTLRVCSKPASSTILS